MPPTIGSIRPEIQETALAFKFCMARSIERAMDENEQLSKKSIAMDLGVTQSALSHWLSTETSFSMPGHLIGLFCQIVGDDSLIWHVQSAHEKASRSGLAS